MGFVILCWIRYIPLPETAERFSFEFPSLSGRAREGVLLQGMGLGVGLVNVIVNVPVSFHHPRTSSGQLERCLN